MRRAAAITIAVALVALVVCDSAVGGWREWWDRHSFTTDVVSSLLVLGVAALIVDEVVARRQRKQRAVSVAVQSLIVFEQARRTYEQVIDVAKDPSGVSSARDEAMNLANMLLIASPALFDDPQARVFLQQVQRLAGWVFLGLGAPERLRQGVEPLDRARAEMSGLRESIRLLATRVPAADAVAFTVPDRPPTPAPVTGSGP